MFKIGDMVRYVPLNKVGQVVAIDFGRISIDFGWAIFEIDLQANEKELILLDPKTHAPQPLTESLLVERWGNQFLITRISKTNLETVARFFEDCGYLVHGRLGVAESSWCQTALPTRTLSEELECIEQTARIALESFAPECASPKNSAHLREHLKKHCKEWQKQLAGIRALREALQET